MAINPRYQLLVATTAEWENKNPVLKDGEPGYEVIENAGVITNVRRKTGDGVTAWNSLPYGKDVYDKIDPATVDIGDIKVNDFLTGISLEDIIEKIVSPFVIPEFTSFKANNQSTLTYEVGVPLLSNYNLDWTFNYEGTVEDDTTGLIYCDEDLVFSNLGNVNLTDLSYALTSEANVTFNTSKQVQLGITGFDTKGNTIDAATLNINWVGKIRYGINSSGSVQTQTDVNNLGNSILSDNIERQYNFLNGYPFILIPDFIDVSGIKFIDADNGLEFSMDLQSVWDSSLPSTVSYNNGYISYNYKIYRGEYFYNAPTSIIIQLN